MTKRKKENIFHNIGRKLKSLFRKTEKDLKEDAEAAEKDIKRGFKGMDKYYHQIVVMILVVIMICLFYYFFFLQPGYNRAKLKIEEKRYNEEIRTRIELIEAQQLEEEEKELKMNECLSDAKELYCQDWDRNCRINEQRVLNERENCYKYWKDQGKNELWYNDYCNNLLPIDERGGCDCLLPLDLADTVNRYYENHKQECYLRFR